MFWDATWWLRLAFAVQHSLVQLWKLQKNLEMKKKIIELIDYFVFCQNGQTSTSFSGKRKPDVSGI